MALRREDQSSHSSIRMNESSALLSNASVHNSEVRCTSQVCTDALLMAMHNTLSLSASDDEFGAFLAPEKWQPQVISKFGAVSGFFIIILTTPLVFLVETITAYNHCATVVATTCI